MCVIYRDSVINFYTSVIRTYCNWHSQPYYPVSSPAAVLWRGSNSSTRSGRHTRNVSVRPAVREAVRSRRGRRRSIRGSDPMQSTFRQCIRENPTGWQHSTVMRVSFALVCTSGYHCTASVCHGIGLLLLPSRHSKTRSLHISVVSSGVFCDSILHTYRLSWLSSKNRKEFISDPELS